MDELYHHGIDGQQWGVRNGPPYPLDSGTHNGVIERVKAKREANKAAKQAEKHEKLVASADAKKVEKYARKGEFTTDELKQIYNRLNMEKQISEIRNYDAQTVLKNISTSMDLISKAASSGTIIYNAFANLHNAKDAKNGGEHQWVVLGQDSYAIRKKKAEAEEAEGKARKAQSEADTKEKTAESETRLTIAKNDAQYWDQKDKSDQQEYEYKLNSAARTALTTSMKDVAFGDSKKGNYAIPADYWSTAWSARSSQPPAYPSKKNKQGN